MKTLLLLFLLTIFSVGTYAQSGSGWDWAANSGAATSAPGRQVLDVATDASGNVYAVGRFQGTTLGGSTISTPGVQNSTDEDAFIIKYNSSGSVQWAKKFGMTGPGSNQFAEVVTADSEGNIYVGGLGMSIYTTNSAFLLKYDTNGNLLWSKTDFALYEIGGINIGPDGNLLVMEQHSGAKNIHKINQATGAVMWTANVSNAGSNSGTTFQDFTDNAGNVYFTAVKINAMNQGDPIINVLGDTYTSTGLASSVIASLDNNGNKRWTQFLEGIEIAHEYTVDKNGKSYARLNGGYGGMFQGISTAQVGGSRYIELNNAGNLTRNLTTSPYKGWMRVTADGIYGTSTLVSSPYGPVTEIYGDYSFTTPTGGAKAIGIVIKYDPANNDKVVWANSLELNGAGIVTGLLRTIELGPNNRIVAGGNYGGTSVKAGSIALTSTSSGSYPTDFFVAQFGADNLAAPRSTSWSGAAGNGSWTDAANWSDGVPTGNEKSVIPAGLGSYPVNIPTTAITGKLVVNSNASLSLPVGFSAPGGLLNDGRVTIIGTGTFQGINISTPVPVSGTGRLVFTASSPSSILYDIPIGMEINKPGGTIQSYGGKLGGSLYLVNGKLELPLNTLVMTDPNAGVSYTATSYISSGTFKRAINSSGTYDFPVGKSTSAQPLKIQLNNVSGPAYLTVTFNSSPSGSTPSVDLGGKTINTLLNNGYWTITPDVALSSGTYDIITEARGYTNGVTDAARFVNIRRENSTAPWTFEGTNGTSTQTGETVSGGVTSNGLIISGLTGLKKFADLAVGIATAAVAPGTAVVTSTWTGTAGDKKWSTAGNWDNGVPNGLVDAVIPSGKANYPEVFTTGENARSITVAPAAYVKFPNTLKAYAGIENNGSIEITSPVGGTFSGFGTNTASGYAVISGSGKLVFAASGPGSMTGTYNQNIEVNRPGAVFGFNNTIVGGSVNLVAGDNIYSMTVNYLTMTNANASINISSPANHLQGNLIRKVSSSGTFNFPMGSPLSSGTTRYAPVSITTNNLTGTDAYSVAFSTTISGAAKLIVDNTPVTKLLNTGRWIITPNVAATGGTLNLTFEGRDYTNGVADASRYVLLGRASNALDWTTVVDAVISQSANVVTVNVTNLPAVNAPAEYAIGIKGSSAIWNGSASTAYATAANWTPAVVPDDSYLIKFVAGSPRYPATFSNSAAIEVASGTTLILPQTVNSTAGIINNGTIEVTGASTFNGFNGGNTPLLGTGKLVFNSASPATISTSTTINNSIEVNRAAGIAISAPINGSLYLTNGLVSGTVTMTNAAATVTYSPTSYLTGTLVRAVGTGSYTFPVGTASRFAPATVNFTAISGATKLTASFSATTTGSFSSSFVANGKAVSKILNSGIWTITPDAAFTGSYNITLEGRGYTNGSADVNNYMVLKRVASNSSWQYFGTNGTPTESADVVTATGNGITGFSDFAIGIASPYETKWTGAAGDKNWSTAANWDNGVPASVQKAVFDNTASTFPEVFTFVTIDKVEVGTGVTLKFPLNTITVNNGIVNNGTIQIVSNNSFNSSSFGALSGNGKLLFNSGSPTTISLNSNPLFSHNIEIDRASLSTNLLGTTNGNVTLTNGIVATFTGLKLNNPDAVLTTAAGTYFTGSLTRAINTTGEYLFPIGAGTVYAPAKLNLSSIAGPTSITAFFNTASSGAAPDLVAEGRTVTSYLNSGLWTISPNVPLTGGSYSVNLEARNYTNGVEDPQAYVVIKRQNSGDNWGFYGTSGLSTQSGGTVSNGVVSNGVVNASVSGLTSFSDFAIGIASPTTLPVRLISFTAKSAGNTSLLSWETGLEVDNDKFVIERSVNGTEFFPIGEVTGRGNSSAVVKYSFRDSSPLNGINYYRLRQIDLNGNAWLSAQRALRFAFAEEIKAYPNPTSSIVYFSGLTEKQYSAKVYSQVGTLVLQTELLNSGVQLSSLAPGNYIVRLISETGKETVKRIVLVR